MILNTAISSLKNVSLKYIKNYNFDHGHIDLHIDNRNVNKLGRLKYIKKFFFPSLIREQRFVANFV